jgi:mRNA interferase RelE/StbE
MNGATAVLKPANSPDLRPIPNKDVQRILKRIAQLAHDPRPPGSEKLSSAEKYRIRQGNYRILYMIDDDLVIVTIVKIGQRRDVYQYW